MKDSVEVRLPGSNRHRIVLRMEESGDRIPPTPFDDLSLYFRNGTTTGSMREPEMRIGGSAHAVNWFIASPTD